MTRQQMNTQHLCVSGSMRQARQCTVAERARVLHPKKEPEGHRGGPVFLRPLRDEKGHGRTMWEIVYSMNLKIGLYFSDKLKKFIGLQGSTSNLKNNFCKSFFQLKVNKKLYLTGWKVS